MSAPHSFGRIAGSTRNGTPVVRSARIKAINAQRVAPQNTTTTAPGNVQATSTSKGPVGKAPVPRSRKRPRDSSKSDDEPIAGSEGDNDDSAEVPRSHKKPRPRTGQIEETSDNHSPEETRSVVKEGQVEPGPQSDQAEEDASIQDPTETRSVANEGQDEPRPKSDQAEEGANVQDPTETRSAAIEGQVDPKSQTDQIEEDAGIQDPKDVRSTTNEGHADNAPSLPEADKSFYHAIITVVLWLRVLDQQRAAQKDCLAKQNILHTLMDRKQPFAANVPVEGKYPNVRESYRSDYARYERDLETRSTQAETAARDIPDLIDSTNARMDRFDDFVRTSTTLPEVACLKDSADFRTIFERCQFHSRILTGLEGEISDVEQERNLADSRIDAYAHRLAAQGLEAAGLITTEESIIPAAEPRDDEYSPAQDFQKNISALLARLEGLKAELQKTKQDYFGHKENLARVAEKLLIEAGMLQPSTPRAENPIPVPGNTGPAPEVPGHPEAVEHDADNTEVVESRSSPDVEENIFAKRQAQHDTLIKELMAAQFHLCDAEKAFKDSRKFTEEELAQLPQNITEDLLGLELKRKLTRTTRNYIDAQNRVKDLQAEGRRLRVPGVDRFPIDQTWDFEDRSDDGYLHSTFADKVERSKPKVEAWLPQIATSEVPLSPPTWPYISKTVFKLAELRLGDDKMDGFPSDGAKQRIARYQEACDELRGSGQFPLAVPDEFISTERLPKLSSHMT